MNEGQLELTEAQRVQQNRLMNALANAFARRDRQLFLDATEAMLEWAFNVGHEHAVAMFKAEFEARGIHVDD